MSWDNGEPADGTRVRVAGIARDVHADALFRHTFPPMPTEGSVGTVTGQSSPSRVVVAWDDGTPSAAWRRGDLEPVAGEEAGA